MSSGTAGSGGSTASKYKAALAYVGCMRSHGVPNFPDPTSDGQINVKFVVRRQGWCAGVERYRACTMAGKAAIDEVVGRDQHRPGAALDERLSGRGDVGDACGGDLD